MTIAWAIIIVAILFFLHKYQLLGKTLRIGGTVTAVFLIGILAWIGWDRLATCREQRQAKEQVALNNDCLDATSGKVHPISNSGPPWCESYESIHQKGAPIDEWALSSDMPNVPPGDYYVTDGDRKPDDVGAATPAELCVDSYGMKRCYAFPMKIDYHTFGLNAKAEEVRVPNGGKLILFTAEDESASNGWRSIALLANKGGQLENLLPEIPDSVERQIWNLPGISSMPILVTTSYDWDMATECHACPHRVRIASYAYRKEEGRYVKYDELITATKHLWPPMERVLEEEKTSILAGLRKASEAETARHVVINP